MNELNEPTRETKEPYVPPSVVDIRPVTTVVKGDSGIDEDDVIE